MNKKGFTLIELLAVLVVLAILALISIPITIRIINNARENSYKRSIASYGKAFELAIAKDSIYNAFDNYKPLREYNIEDMYSGNRVQCDLENSSIENGKLNLAGCMIVKEIKDNYNPSDRISKNIYTYHNGELTQDTIYDYRIGDTFTLNNDLYYIIKNSPEEDDYVVALKDHPLTIDEINSYGTGHINRYTGDSQGVPYDIKRRVDGINVSTGYGGVAYYTSPECGNGSLTVQHYVGCKNEYSESDVKAILQNWINAKFSDQQLKEIDGYKVRLINLSELMSLGYVKISTSYPLNENVPSWLYDEAYSYWTMTKSSLEGAIKSVWVVSPTGKVTSNGYVFSIDPAVRPVINVKKSVIESSD